MTNFVIRNQTLDYLVLEGSEHVLNLPPLQRTRIGGDPKVVLGRSALMAQRDNALVWEQEPIRSTQLLMITWCTAIGTATAVAGVVGYVTTRRAVWLVTGLGTAVALLAITLAVTIRAQHRTRQSEGAEPKNPLEPGRIRNDFWQLCRDFLVGSTQGLILVLVVIFGIAAPAAAIYYGSELPGILRLEPWRVTFTSGAESYSIVVGRVLVLLTIVLMSLVPALMYFQFDREKLNTLIDRWLHSIFRLDPSLDTVADVDAKYGRRVEEYYGASLGTGVDPPRKRVRSRSPLVVATLLIATGWIVVLLQPTPITSDPDQASFRVEQMFHPAPTPMTFAFLGAYFLAVQVTLRGYVRGDLRPKTYNVIIVRIIVAVILAWVLEGLFGGGVAVLATSFLAGFLPNTVLRRIREVGVFLNVKSGDLLRNVRQKHRMTNRRLPSRVPRSRYSTVLTYMSARAWRKKV
jgi:hypothetical protein